MHHRQERISSIHFLSELYFSLSRCVLRGLTSFQIRLSQRLDHLVRLRLFDFETRPRPRDKPQQQTAAIATITAQLARPLSIES